MSLVLTEEQQLLRDTAREFVTSQCTIDALRTLRDERTGSVDEAGHDVALWKEMAELGWLGIPFPESYGGADLGHAELGVVLEELGRRLVVTPFLSTVLLGGGVMAEAGSESQKAALLPGVCEGRLLLTLAFQETTRHAPFVIETSARSDADGYVISGNKILVLDGAAADHVVVAARTSGEAGDRHGLTLFLVEGTAAGLRRTRTFLIDSRSAANLVLEDVRVDREAVVGEVDQGADVLEAVLDRAAVALSAEMMGGIQESFDRTVAYLKEREQFGVKIGSFQALKHRAARWFCEVELTRSIVLQAQRALDAKDPNAAELASACKARASDTFRLSGEEGIQMHGGIGVTDEDDIGFFMKRARVSELLLGDASFHRDRFAALRAY